MSTQANLSNDPDNYSDIGNYLQERTKRQLQSQKKNVIKRCIEEGHKAIAQGNIEQLRVIVNQGLNVLLPVGKTSKRQYYKKARELDLYFDWADMNLYLKDKSKYSRKPDVLEAAFYTYESVAALEHIVSVTANQTLPIYELGTQVAERKVSATSQLDSDQHIVTETDDEKITFIGGDTGSGKSTFLETLALARLYNGEKIIDLHDTVEGENILYDVPTDDEILADIRSKVGVEAEFQKNPDLEVLVPLNKSLSESKATEKPDRSSVLRPFTIPASDISRDSLIQLIDPTDAKAKYLRRAHEELEGDWTLEDLSEQVAKTGATADVVNGIQRNIERLQNRGYIRDHQDEHTLDWEEIFQDVGKITSISTMFVEDRSESIMITVYLLNKIKAERERIKQQYADKSKLPRMTLCIREIHNLAPSNRQISSKDRLRSVQRYSIGELQEISSYHRHLSMRVVADAQLLGTQVANSVQSMAHRIYQFSSNYVSVSKSFKSRVQVDGSIIESVADYDTGMCALIDQNGYTMPIQAVPPPCRHFDTQKDMNGWAVRAELTDETFTEIDVDTTLPERFEFESDSEGVSEQDPPVDRFLKNALKEDSDHWLPNPDLWAAWKVYSTSRSEGMQTTKSELFQRLRELYDLDSDDKKKRSYDGRHSEADRVNGYVGVDFTEWGRTHHKEDPE